MNRGLNSFRALAFLSVFAFHSGLFQPGYLGVQAFFVLSGFLLTPIMVDMKENMAGQKFFVNFYGRRILRIFPLYYFYLFIILLVFLLLAIFITLNNGDGINEVMRFLGQMPWAFVYMYDFLYATVFCAPTPFLTHLWSLAVEEQFYLIWPVVIFLVKKKHLKMVMLIAILLGPIWRLLIALLAQSGEVAFLVNRVDLVVYVMPFSHIDAFAIGGFFALYRTSNKSYLYILTLLGCSISLGYLAEYVSTKHITIADMGYTSFMRYQYIWGYSLINYVFATIITQIKDAKFFPRLFSNSSLNYLGKISYGLYIFHNPVILLSGNSNPFLSLLITICVSALSYELFEKRFIKMKDKLFSKNPESIHRMPTGC